MKNNFGAKLKQLSDVIFYLGLFQILAQMVFYLAIGSTTEALSFLFITPLIVLGIRIGTYLMYGFGQLIENTDIIASHYQEQQPKNTRNMEITALISNEAIDEDTVVNFVCPACENKISCTKKHIKNKEINSCPACNTPISFT